MGPIHFDTNYERLLSSKTCEWIESLGPILHGSIRVRPLADFEIGVIYMRELSWLEHRIQVPDALRIFGEPKNLVSLEALYKVLGPAEEPVYRGDKDLLRRIVKLAGSPTRSGRGSAESRGLLADIGLVATVSLARFYGARGPTPEGMLACKLRDQKIVLQAGIKVLERLSRSLPNRYEAPLRSWKSELETIQRARSLQRGALRMQARAKASLENLHSLGIAA